MSVRRKKKKKRNSKSQKALFKEYEKATGEYPIYRGNETTLGFKIWKEKKEVINDN